MEIEAQELFINELKEHCKNGVSNKDIFDFVDNYYKQSLSEALEDLEKLNNRVNKSEERVKELEKFPNRDELKELFSSKHYDSKNGHHKRVDYKKVTGAEELIKFLTPK